MTNTALYMNLIDRYNAIAFTHNYIWGFIYKKNVYMAITTSEVMPYVCTLDKASRGAGYAIRFKPNMAQKAYMLNECKTFTLCNVEDL